MRPHIRSIRPALAAALGALLAIAPAGFAKDRPMALPDGKSIAPTGKAYKFPMATIGHWNKDGVMDEEYLFWDNAEFMKQIGLGQ